MSKRKFGVLLGAFLALLPFGTSTQSPPFRIVQITDNAVGDPIGVGSAFISGPALTEDATRVVFYMGSINLPSGGKIFSARADGTDLQQISPLHLNVGSMHFAGGKVAFVACEHPCGWSQLSHPGDVWVMNSDGTDPVQLTFDGDICNRYEFLRASANGEKVVFGSEHCFAPPPELEIINTDRSERHQLPISQLDLGSSTRGGILYSGFPYTALSADGMELAFLHVDPAVDDHGRIALLNTATFAIQTVVDLGSTATRITFALSGDGRALAFSSAPLYSGLFVVRAGGSSLTQVAPAFDPLTLTGFGLSLALDYDGSLIAYDRYMGQPEHQEIYVVNSDGTGSRQLTQIGVCTINCSDPKPAISANGVAVAFVSSADLDAGKNTDLSREVFVLTLGDPHWSAYQHDAQHTGRSPYSGPSSNNATPIFDLGGFTASSPVVGPSGLYYLVRNLDDTRWDVLAIGADGVLALQTAEQASPCRGSTSSPTIANDGSFYVTGGCSQGHAAYGFYPNGQLRWVRALGGGSMITLGHDGTVYVTSGSWQNFENVLLALRPDGSELWRYDYDLIPGLLQPAAVAPNGNVVVVGMGFQGSSAFVEAHDPTTGQVLWRRYPNSTSVASAPSIGDDGTIYFTSGYFLFAWPGDGAPVPRWSAPLQVDDAYTSTPALAPNGAIRVLTGLYGTNPGRLHSFSAAGVPEWQLDLTLGPGQIPLGEIAIDNAGTSYVSLNLTIGCAAGTPCANLFAVDPHGSLVWSYSTPSTTSLIIDAPNTAYVVLHDGTSHKLYAIGQGVPPPPPADSDSDGVPDNLDQCPGTPPGTPVDSSGCAFPAIAAISVSPTSLDFGTIPVGRAVTRTLTIVNTGTATLNIADIATPVGAFALSPVSLGPIAPTVTAQLQVTFAALAAGVATGTLTLTSNAPTSPTIVPLTGTGIVPRVSSVTWEALSSPLDPNPNAGGGGRIFADRRLLTDNPDDRRHVRLRATLNVQAANIPVFFRTFDPDDPSTDVGPVDPNGLLGRDNRGNSALACAEVDTTQRIVSDVNGVAEITFREVKAFPGDNYLAAASTDEAYLNGLCLTTGSNLRDVAGHDLPTAQAQRTEVLTVWRRLHVEVDSMGSVPGVDVQGNNRLTGIILSAAPGFLRTTLAVDVPLTENGRESNRFESGKLTIDGLGSFAVSRTAGRSIVIDGVVSHLQARGREFTLVDDDDFNGDDAPHNLDGDLDEDVESVAATFSKMEESDDPERNVFAPAYIRPIYDEGGVTLDNDNVEFVLNVDAVFFTKILEKWDSGINERDDYWVAHVQLGYQPAVTRDHDPDGEGFLRCALSEVERCVQLGATDTAGHTTDVLMGTVPRGAHHSMLFLETIRDYAKVKGERFLRRVAPHEVGHQFGLKGDTSGHGIMSPDGQDAFVPAHLDLLRWRVRSPGCAAEPCVPPRKTDGLLRDGPSSPQGVLTPRSTRD